MAADSVENSEALLQRVCDLLNGTAITDKKPVITYDGPEILLNGKAFLVVRGWGHLIGSGGLALSAEKATSIQEEFAKFVMSRLSLP